MNKLLVFLCFICVITKTNLAGSHENKQDLTCVYIVDCDSNYIYEPEYIHDECLKPGMITFSPDYKYSYYRKPDTNILLVFKCTTMISKSGVNLYTMIPIEYSVINKKLIYKE